ncbi:pepsin-like aspartyl protease, partial [Klebsiella pneumoniae]|uniref:pepsin-like aspartyl protease n=1 Tax=Klebsiella pneumoniae TaxID=573 RepID=UPI0013D0116F
CRWSSIALAMGSGFDNMMNRHLVAQDLFSVYMDRNSQESMLTLGAIDPSYYTGSLHWVPLE